MSLYFISKFICIFFFFFFRFHIEERSHNISPSLSDLLYSVWQSLGPSICWKWYYSILFNGWILFGHNHTHIIIWPLSYTHNCICVPHLLSPFLCWWTCGLLPCLGYCKKCCNVHWGACTFLSLNIVFPRYRTRGLLLCTLYMGLLACHAARKEDTPSSWMRVLPLVGSELVLALPRLHLLWSDKATPATSRARRNIEWERARSIIHKMPSSQ